MSILYSSGKPVINTSYNKLIHTYNVNDTIKSNGHQLFSEHFVRPCFYSKTNTVWLSKGYPTVFNCQINILTISLLDPRSSDSFGNCGKTRIFNFCVLCSMYCSYRLVQCQGLYTADLINIKPGKKSTLKCYIEKVIVIVKELCCVSTEISIWSILKMSLYVLCCCVDTKLQDRFCSSLRYFKPRIDVREVILKKCKR